MVAYSFKPQFVAPIIAGTKRQTIRADRRRHAFIGEELQLYTGMRTKQCRLIGTAICTSIQPVRIDFVLGEIEHAGERYTVGRNRFAALDGFMDFEEMQEFWRANHPGIEQFSGVLIQWAAFRAAVPAGPAHG